MKTLISLLFSALFFAPTVDFGSVDKPSKSEVVISEAETKKFTDDPIAYISKNFNLKEHSSFNAHGGAEYAVTFKSLKGILHAVYDSEGKLISTRLKFRDISIPREVMAEIHRDYQGWEVVSIDYRAFGRGEIIRSSRYDIKLKKDNQEVTFVKKMRASDRTLTKA